MNRTSAAALGVLAFALAAGIAVAQEAEAPAEGTEAPAAEAPAEGAPAEGAQPEAGFSTGQVVDGVGSTYTEAEFDDWDLNCIRTEDGADPCQLYQLLNDQNGNAVAEISMTALPPGQEAVAGATIVTPLETLLTEQLTIAVDGGATKRYPFTFCAAIGCISRVGFTAEDIAAFKAGASATITVVPARAPDQRVTAQISLKGFTAGFDRVAELAAERNAAPAQE